MPAGVTWGTYLKLTTAALLSMFAGAQVVHQFYNPLQDMEKLVDEEVKKLQKELVDEMESGKIKLGPK